MPPIKISRRGFLKLFAGATPTLVATQADARADRALANGLVGIAVRITGAGGGQQAGAGDRDDCLFHGYVLHPSGSPHG